jgi:hypothetical protein
MQLDQDQPGGERTPRRSAALAEAQDVGEWQHRGGGPSQRVAAKQDLEHAEGKQLPPAKQVYPLHIGFGERHRKEGQ